MKVLMMNISAISNDSDVKNIEGFFISFGFITQNVDTMITDLVNRAFTHFIEMISNLTINVDTEFSIKNVDTEISIKNVDTKTFIIDSNLDLFAYIVTKRYTAKKIYDIMIDTNASKRFTTDYGQFLIYNKDSQISINTENVGAVHV